MVESRIPEWATIGADGVTTVCGARLGSTNSANRTAREAGEEEPYTWEKLQAMPHNERCKYLCSRPPDVKVFGKFNGRCRFHGGRAGAPVKTGKHAKYEHVEGKTAPFVEKAREGLKEEIAILSMLLDRKLQEYAQIDASVNYRDILKTIDNMFIAIKQGKLSKVLEELRALQEIALNGELLVKTENEIRKLIQEVAVVSEKEFKRMALAGEYISKEAYIFAIKEVFKIAGELVDERNKNALRAELTKFIRGGLGLSDSQQGAEEIIDAQFNDSDKESGTHPIRTE